MTKRSIQSLGAQEVDVTVIPVDLFRQDLSNPADPILDFQDRAIRARRVESPNILATERVETPLVEAETLVSTAPTGTTPLILTSTTKVNNLNADMLDGFHAGNASGQVPISNGNVNTNLNADFLDGFHAGNASGQVPISNGTVNANLIAEKAVKQTLSTVSANTTLDSNACIIEVTTANAVTLTIPSGLSIGHQYRIKRTVASANGISVITSGSETIEGGTSFTVQGPKVSAVLDTGEVVIEKVSSTAWAFVGGQVSGSNSNGAWIKLSDGTMICYHYINPENMTLSSDYFGWAYNVRNWTFPHQYISTPYANVSLRVDSNIAMLSDTGASNAQQFSHFVAIPLQPPQSVTLYHIKYFAIGRWK